MATDFKFELQHNHSRWRHSHNFAFGHEDESERRTMWVFMLTLAMTAAEIAAGWLFNSIALFADGWHMSTHATALGIGYFAYRYARLNARNPSYTFGTGKVHALGSYSSALVLALVAIFVLVESVRALLGTHVVAFNQALPVAVLGLLVNLVSVRLLHMDGHSHGHDHGDGHVHAKGLENDTNRRAAYAHVVVDAMTSVLAILALLAGKFLNWSFMDPLVGIVAAAIIAQWAYALLRTSMVMLLDRQPSLDLSQSIKSKVESDGDSEVADLHLWHVAPGRVAAIVSVVSHKDRTVDDYKRRLSGLDLAHVTVELNYCAPE